jgi:ParB family chromosome partitioning protein
VPAVVAANKGSGSSFKDSYSATATFTGGFCDPSDVTIVGLDCAVEDWNEDLADDLRLAAAPPTQALVDSILAVGVRDEVKVTKRRGIVLVVDGRRRVQAARAANAILKKKTDPSEFVQIPIVPDKSGDQEITVRIGNEHRADDPPWIKARNAARLRDRGRDDATIRAVFGVEPVTLKNWAAYMDLDPAIQAQVESGAIPFAVGFEIGKLGRGEKNAQTLALDTLKNMGAQLSGEQGRANVKAVAEQIRSGALKTPPPPPRAALVPSHNPAAPAAPGTAATAPQAPPARPARPPAVVTDARPRPAVVGRILAILEPTPAEPHETDQIALAYRIAAFYAGQDPDLEGLAQWPDVQSAFRKALAMKK